MAELPSGTVTFLFTDIEGSTTRWEEHRQAMQTALARHDAILREAIEAHGGMVFKTVGDAFYAVFTAAPDAINAALVAQHALQAEPWDEAIGSLRVRMALHTGTPEARGGDYFGPPLNRVARLLNAGHGRQVLLSAVAQGLVREALPPGVELRDLGEHRLKDLAVPERIFQVVAPDLPVDFPPLRVLDTVPTNLPVQLTSFVGRERAMAEVQRLLATTHLLTLTGPGGIGKSRLAVHAAADLVEQVRDGVWLVELAPLADPTLVPQRVATALGVREQPGRLWIDTLIDYLRSKQLLLILDNCEHLIDACAALAEQLLHACPRLKILASSREALGIAGETVFRVPSLAVPDLRTLPSSAAPLPGGHLPSMEDLARHEAVRLFVERAQSVLPDFQLTSATARMVAQICQRLDGIPLALELAAARVPVLAVEQIAARLDDRFRLLTGGSRTAVPRQQTLRAVIDWSWDLLSEGERILLRRLGVFVGGWTLEAAEAVTGDAAVPAGQAAGAHVLEAAAVLDVLAQLVNKSLVLAERHQGTVVRYRLLETIRQYARDKLLDAREAARVRDQHLLFFLRYAETAAAHLQGPDLLDWLDRLEIDYDNLRAALGWALEHDPHRALELAGALEFFWRIRGYLVEGQTWLRDVLARTATPSLAEGETDTQRVAARAKALAALGGLTMTLGDASAARTTLEESLRLARQAGDHKLLADGLALLAFILAQLGEAPAALAAVEESEAICRREGYTWELASMLARRVVVIAWEQGDVAAIRAALAESVRLAQAIGNPWLSAYTLFTSAMLANRLGESTEARAQLAESLELFEALRDRHFANTARSELAHLLRRQGNDHEALPLYREALVQWLELGHRAAVAHQFESFAFIAAAHGQQPEGARRAARLLGAAEVVRETANAAMSAVEREEYDRAVTSIHTQLDETAFVAAWAEGRAMPLEQAVAFALEETPDA